MSASKKQKTSPSPIQLAVIVNGLPGAMGREVSAACARRSVKIAPFALTGPNMPETIDMGEGIGSVKLMDATKPEAQEALKASVEELKTQGFTVVAIDFTHPSAVNANAEMYNAIGLPFVMGTTGGDREKLFASTVKSKNHAVIAPNMCKQIVAFQAMFKYMEDTFPGAFTGYDLTVTESHQKSKADTSGTAKAVVKSLATLNGVEFPEEKIAKIRTDEESQKFGVPAEHLTGHAHHTYRLTSGDKTVEFVFQHNVNGRSTYAEGVADAVLYLGSRCGNKRNKPKVYDMIDVLKSGEMTS